MIRNISGIYAITSPSGKAYIGSTHRMSRRRIRHFNDLRNNRHHCEPLQRAWNKYGDNFNFVILEICPVEKLIEREQFWMDCSANIWNGTYNARSIAGTSGPLDETTKAKISARKMGVPLPESTKQKMRKPKSFAHAAAISAGRKGKVKIVYTDERRRNQAIAISKSWAERKRPNAVQRMKESWTDERRLNHRESCERTRVKKHIEWVEWTLGVDYIPRKGRSGRACHPTR